MRPDYLYSETTLQEPNIAALPDNPILAEGEPEGSKTGSELVCDEEDHWMSQELLEAVKSIVYFLMRRTLYKYTEEPNMCLEDDEPETCPYYYRKKFPALMRRLYTPNFIMAIQHFLRGNHFAVHVDRVMTVVEMVLLDLKSAKLIFPALSLEFLGMNLNRDKLLTAYKIWERPMFRITIRQDNNGEFVVDP